MGLNYIDVYQQNDKGIICDVSGLVNLDGYRPAFTVKKSLDGTPVIEKDGSASGLQISFNLTYEDTSIAAGNYIYDIVIDNSTNRYTVAQDDFTVLDSVKY